MTNCQPTFQSQHNPSSIFAEFHDSRLVEGPCVSQSWEIEISIILTAVSSNKVDAIKHWCDYRNIAWFKPFLALEYLSTPATSAPIEIVFSVCGHILSARGCNLSKVVKCKYKDKLCLLASYPARFAFIVNPNKIVSSLELQ